MLVSKTREKREKNKNASESTHSVIRPLIFLFFQDKNVWLSIIEMLRKQDKLPIVAFTFSKKKINENASALSSLDLTTSSEKSEVHVFFQKCVSRLKPPDRQLPQVRGNRKYNFHISFGKATLK